MYIKCNFCMIPTKSIVFLIIFELTTSIFGEIVRNVDSAANGESGSKMSFWDLVAFKRNLQLQGQYPVVFNVNGILKKVYVNQRTNVPNINELQRLRHQQQQSRRSPPVKHSDNTEGRRISTKRQEHFSKQSELNQQSRLLSSSNLDRVQPNEKPIVKLEAHTKVPPTPKENSMKRSVESIQAVTDKSEARIIRDAKDELNASKISSWELLTYKRKLQSQGKYPVVYNVNGTLMKLYVNQASGVPNINELLRQQNIKQSRSKHESVLTSSKNSTEKSVVSKTSPKRSGKTLDTTTDQKEVEQLKEDIILQKPYVYRQLSAHDEFSVPLESIETAMRFGSKHSTPTMAATEPTFNIEPKINDDIHRFQQNEIIGTNANEGQKSSDSTKVKSKHNEISSNTKSTAKILTTATMSLEVVTNPSDRASMDTKQIVQNLETVAATVIDTSTVIPTEFTIQDGNTETTIIDSDQTVFTESLPIAQTTNKDEVVLTTESYNLPTGIPASDESTTHFEDYLAGASVTNNLNERPYIESDAIEDEYKSDSNNRRQIDRIDGNKKSFSRSISRRESKDIRKEVNDIQSITNDDDPVLMRMLGDTNSGNRLDLAMTLVFAIGLAYAGAHYV